MRIANERVKEFENRLIPKIEAVSNGLNAFADPSFQLLLIDAQKAAVATERVVDYDLLSELLVHRIEKGNDKHIRTGIHRSVEIIEDISDEALLGLNRSMPVPMSEQLKSAIKSIIELYSKDTQKNDVEKKFLLGWNNKLHLALLKD